MKKPFVAGDRGKKMSLLDLILLTAALLIAGYCIGSHASPKDPNLVSYWLNRLERICVHEEQLVQASEWEAELEPGALNEWTDSLRSQIKKEMKQIEKECR